MDNSLRPPDLFPGNNLDLNPSPSIQDDRECTGVDAKDDSFTPPSLLEKETGIRDKGKHRACGNYICFALGDCRFTHLLDPVSVKPSTSDAASDGASELKCYIRSYSPYMDDGFSTDTSTASAHFKDISQDTSSVSTDTTQGVNICGPKTLVSKDGNDTDSDESVYASAPGSEPHMDYEASIFVRGPILYSHVTQGKVPDIDDGDSGDLARSIKGFYRILDLIVEQGSGGLGGVLCSYLILC